MVTRPKLELEINKSVQIQKVYKDPVTGQSEYGTYFLYCLKCEDGREYSYFANEQVHDELKNLNVGETATLTKLAARHGSKVVTKYILESNKSETPNKSKEQEVKVNGKDSNGEDSNQPDKYYSAMLQSYKEAIQIQEEMGFVDMSNAIRIAITMFIQRSK